MRNVNSIQGFVSAFKLNGSLTSPYVGILILGKKKCKAFKKQAHNIHTCTQTYKENDCGVGHINQFNCGNYFITYVCIKSSHNIP